MSMNIYAIPGRPHDFAASGIAIEWSACPTILDFSRPLIKWRRFGKLNKWIGPVIGLGVPFVHVAQRTGGCVGTVVRGDPNFPVVLRLWKQHYKSQRTIFGSSIVAALGAFSTESGFSELLP